MVVLNIREDTPKTRTFRLLHKHVAVIGVRADRCEDHGDSLLAEVLAGGDAGGSVVYPADGHIAGEIDACRDRRLKAKSVSSAVVPVT